MAKVKKLNSNGQTHIRALETAAEELKGALARIELLLQKVDPKTLFSQGLLRVGVALKGIGPMTEHCYKLFEATALRHIEGGGTFQHGKVAATVSRTERRYPSWKGEALLLAESVAGLKGDPWDEKQFVEDVAGKYELKISEKIKLVESA